jgi:hypothetical protein
LFRLWVWVSMWILSNEMQYAVYLDQQLLINVTIYILVKKCWKWKCGRGWLLDFCRICPSLQTINGRSKVSVEGKARSKQTSSRADVAISMTS